MKETNAPAGRATARRRIKDHVPTPRIRHLPPGHAREGAAIIIILVLLVMLFILPMAFFFQSTMQRRTSNASATMMLEGVLAEGAIEVIMSDLEQEIAWGSTPTVNVVTNVATGMVYTNLIYYPTSSSNMVPALAGSSGTNGLENLLKRSAYGVSLFPNGPSLAVQSSTTNPSMNGLSVSRARWNEHLLLARASPNSSTDTTPTNSFTPPDWILVARDGSTPSAWSSSLCWSMTNTTTVTGRYAYAIYEEGGLLDANVAGYPTSLTNQSALPVCGKGGTFFADLTQIGLDATQINALVAWRNYASAAATGVFPSYSFPDNGANYSLAVLGNPHGFMATYNTNTVACVNSSGIGTDHQFVSRQELISFLKMCEPAKAAAAMNALRYLGNFNRSLNQPSFAPDSNRPKVGANDDSINPAFLSVSVNSANFIRNNSSKAYVGDPLVKRRFPLSLLSWITYAGPTNFRLLAITTDPLSAATNGNIPTTSYLIGAAWIPQSGATITWQTNTATNLNTNNSILSFNIPLNRQDLFREPTLLIKTNIPSGSSLAGSTPFTLGPSSRFTAAYQYGAVNDVSDNRQYIGIPMGTVPMAFAGTFSSNGIAAGTPGTNSAGIAPAGYVTYGSGGPPNVTYLLQCRDYYGNWITYDEKYTSIANATNGYGLPNTGTNNTNAIFMYNQNKTFYSDSINTNWSKNAIGSEWSVLSFDPRTSRFGMAFSGCNGGTNSEYSFPLGAALGLYTASNAPLYTAGWAAPIGSSVNGTAMQYAAQQNAVLTTRPDEYPGMFLSALSTGPTVGGWYPGGSNSIVRPGMFAQNNPNVSATATNRFAGDKTPIAFTNQYFVDDDGVVRRGMGAYVPTNSFSAMIPSSSYPSGLPLLPSYQFDSSGNATAISDSLSANANEYLSRPVILNRPFRSIGELGSVFSSTPWRNLDCSTPESGAAALMDVFCINDSTDTLALVAGRVNLNTRQIPVLQAILTGAYKEEFNPANSLVNSPMSTNLANAVAQALVTRTLGTTPPAGPLVNISELAGKWYSQTTVSGTSYVNGSRSYAGFSDDQISLSTNDLAPVLSNASLGTDPEVRVQRLRDSTIRALSSSGQTRVWNVMIDLFVQTGRYPSTAMGFNNFMVDGLVHYWIHLSIDRLTGQLLDRRVETVKE